MVSLADVLDDLCAYGWTRVRCAGNMFACRRFLANLPAEESTSLTRLGFQVEQAYWFYEDFYRLTTPQALPKLSLKAFCECLLAHCPFSLPALGLGYQERASEAAGLLIDQFYEYKAHVPTCGAILLNDTLSSALMVRGFSSKSTWGFPKGKIAKDELPAACAHREVREETGFDIGPYLAEEHFIQIENGGQPIRLYIIAGIPEGTAFAPLTRREIKEISWHPLGWLEQQAKGSCSGAGSHRYYNVIQFMGPLRRWIRAERKRRRQPLKEESVSGEGEDGREIRIGWEQGLDMRVDQWMTEWMGNVRAILRNGLGSQ